MRKVCVALFLVLVLVITVSPAIAAPDSYSSSIVRIFGNIEVEEDQVIHGDVVAIFGNVEINGEVFGNVVTVFGNTTVSSTGKVWEDTVTVVGNLVTESGSTITGSKVNVIGTGGEFRFPSIRIGNLAHHAIGLQFNFFRALGNLAFSVLLAVLIVALFPVPVERIKKSIEGDPGKMALTGLLAWLVIVPLIFIVAITIIGIPLALLMGAVVWVAGKLGSAALVLIIGRTLLKDTESAPAVTALGALLLGAATLVPIVGHLINLAVALVTIGAVTVTRFGSRYEAKA